MDTSQNPFDYARFWHAPKQRQPIVRPRNRILSGVSSGLAKHLGISETKVRLFFVLSNLAMGAGLLLYLWLWAFTPNEKTSAQGHPIAIRRSFPFAIFMVFVTFLAGLSVIFTLGNSLPILWAVLWATSVGAVLWTIRVDKTDPARTQQQQRLVLLFVPIFLMAFGLSVALRGNSIQTIELVLGYLTIILSAIILLVPPISARIRERFDEQASLAQTEQRAEIAAHLHDSVLQTLALIQNRAGNASEVGRIARAQERELRDWLYSGSAPVTQNLAAELRDIASELELEHEVTFELVAVGISADEESGENDVSAELVAAAREAMLNAARHAGGNVSVYLEVAAGKNIDLYIRDRGPGFDPDALPDDRFGVRSS
ncbi:MAG: PspC domain-containing protein, partial [Microbacteriaceae bacterium]